MMWDGSITACYSITTIPKGKYCGGLIGEKRKSPKVTSSFWDIGTSGTKESDGGVGLETGRMMRRETFTDAGWDFDAVWTIDEKTSYPYFIRDAGSPDVPRPDLPEYGLGVWLACLPVAAALCLAVGFSIAGLRARRRARIARKEGQLL